MSKCIEFGVKRWHSAGEFSLCCIKAHKQRLVLLEIETNHRVLLDLTRWNKKGCFFKNYKPLGAPTYSGEGLFWFLNRDVSSNPISKNWHRVVVKELGL